MRIGRTAIRERNGQASRVGRAGLRIVKMLVSAGYSVIGVTLTPMSATAHVKWFVNCNPADDPLPATEVFTKTFFLFFSIFLVVLYVGCKVERTALGANISQLIDRMTATLHRRADDLLRSVAAVSFALLWADGRLILTPELKASSLWLSAIQLLVPLYMFYRATLPAAGVGIIVLYGHGIATYGLFHMLDYPVFVGLGVFFVLSVAQDEKLQAFRFDFLRWTLAASLLWPAMEKFVYPGWVAPIAITHHEITLGFDVTTVVTAAGVVESGLSFALFWTPLVRRAAAAVFIVLLTSATFDFGKVDGIGHMVIITIFLVVLADRPGTPKRCLPILAPVIGGMAVPAVIFLYTGGHAIYYGSKTESATPFLIGVALLSFIYFCINAMPQPRQPRATVVGAPQDRWRPDASRVPSGSAEAGPGGVAQWHGNRARRGMGRPAF